MDYDCDERMISVSDDEIVRYKDRRLRDDDEARKPRKKSRLSHPRKNTPYTTKIRRILNELKKSRNIRAEAKLKPLKPPRIIKSKQNDSKTDGYGKSDDDDDVFVHSNDPPLCKRLRLEKSALNEKSDAMRLKHNKKIMEMRKVDDILMEVKNKTIADSLKKRDNVIDISSDDEFSDESVDESESSKKNAHGQLSTPHYNLRQHTTARKNVPETITSAIPFSKYVTIVYDTSKPIVNEMEKPENKEKQAALHP